ERAAAVVGWIRGLLQKAPTAGVPLAVNDVIREACDLCRRAMAHRGVAVKLELADDLPAVVAKPVPLQQVLLNLISNGADGVEQLPRPERILAVRSGRDEAGHVLVAVRDAGAGLDAANQQLIFEAFFSTKPDGMGMGLAICKSILAAHGGRIWA